MANTTGRKFGGRQKGTPNKDVKDLRERIGLLLACQWDNLIKDLEGLSPKERIDTYIKLLEYSLPKLSRTIIEEEPEQESSSYDFSKLSKEELEMVSDILRKAEVGEINDR